MTVRTYGQLSYTVAVPGAAEVMRGQPDPSRLVAATGALERLSGVPQLCERRRRPAEVAKHCCCLSPSDPLCQPEVGGRIFPRRRGPVTRSRFYERGCQHKHLTHQPPTGTKPIVAASPV